MDGSGATFSDDRRYRYRLWRTWSRDRPALAFIMLNPSTADATADDPTLRRCMGFARRHGFGGVDIVNLFGLRSLDPKALRDAADPVGPANDRHIADVASASSTVVAAWGTGGRLANRDRQVLDLLGHRPLHCLSLTKTGSPGHPLYLAGDLPLTSWNGAKTLRLAGPRTDRAPARTLRFSAPAAIRRVAPSRQVL